ncbi:hypothetical protein OH76DRAFT_157221 [Lentinus brumalis]|uniref:Uncharacterized protein n=1 Tax=Lentinus brumalis TaxID=2498619 RepID=A0A371DIS2_9APHY|nr:hypothetical protein OH76DRAFT_157221 [Polyporus brumalis]
MCTRSTNSGLTSCTPAGYPPVVCYPVDHPTYQSVQMTPDDSLKHLNIVTDAGSDSVCLQSSGDRRDAPGSLGADNSPLILVAAYRPRVSAALYLLQYRQIVHSDLPHRSGPDPVDQPTVRAGESVRRLRQHCSWSCLRRTGEARRGDWSRTIAVRRHSPPTDGHRRVCGNQNGAPMISP